MAEFRTWDAFDLKSVDLGAQYQNATKRFIDSDYRVHGVDYPDALVLEFGTENPDTVEFYGHDITFDDAGTIDGGAITALYTWFVDETDGEWYYNLEFRGFEISAQSLHEAQLTESRLDDQVVLKAAFAGDDSIILSAGRDRMFGFDGNDTMVGGRGSDRLVGGRGADEIDGGKGADWLSGNAGRDRFLFGADSGADVITDFETGTDKIRILAGATGFADLTLTESDKGVLVSFGEASILLRDASLATVAEGDFLFG